MAPVSRKKYSLLNVLLRPEGIILIAAFLFMPLVTGFVLYQQGKEDLRQELGELCESLKALVPTEQYLDAIARPTQTAEQRQALTADLSVVHRSNPQILYIYTLRGTPNGWWFLIDTVQDPATAKVVQRYHPQVTAADWMEPYDYPETFESAVARLAKVPLEIDPDPYSDRFGETIGCEIVLKQTTNEIHLLGVDYDAQELVDLRNRIQFGVLIGVLMGLALLIISQNYLRIYLNAKSALMSQLEVVSNTDMVTELPNRRAFFNHAETMLRSRALGTPFSLAIVDIDMFKTINDRFGHDAGDKALRTFGDLLRTICAGPDFFVARIGGEEFAVCCATDNHHDLLRMLQKFQVRLTKLLVKHETGSHRMTFSAGVATVWEDSLSLTELLRRADIALYESKANGRDCITSVQC